MEQDLNPVKAALEALVVRLAPQSTVQKLNRLTGGASQQMWSFDMVSSEEVQPLILRLAGGWNGGGSDDTLALPDEARLIECVGRHDVPVPRVHYVLKEEDRLGIGYLMQRVEGETLPQRILRDEAYAQAREVLARQCGRILAGIHQVPLSDLPFLRKVSTAEAVESMYREYRGYGEPRPVFEVAFRWLRENLPAENSGPTLVHGDFRNGNLMINRNGMRAVLDWELAHVGDPMADLGWMCVNSWRFGNSDMPVGGFGSREELFAGYQEASGIEVDPRRVAFWEVFGSLKWGIICQRMTESFLSGLDRTVERGAIGRRASEAEVDLLNLLAPRTGVSRAGCL